MIPSTTHTFKTVDGCTIEADVYPSGAKGPAPVVVWIHGGALIIGHRGQMRTVLRKLLHESGFAQVSIDYRLAPETKLPQLVEDVFDALRWVRKAGPTLFQADPERVAVLGSSAGGYLALLCGCCTEPRPKAVVSYYGYGDLIGDWYSKPDPFYCAQPRVAEEEALAVVGAACISNDRGTKDRFRFYLWCRQNGLWPREILGVDPAQDPAAFRDYCPLQNVTPDYPPTLLFHGTGDTDVPFQQSALMARALQEAQVPHELVRIENGAHGFEGGVKEEDLHKPEQSAGLRSFYKTVQFLSRWV